MAKNKKIVVLGAFLLLAIGIAGGSSLTVRQHNAKTRKIIAPVDSFSQTENKIDVKLIVNTGANKYEYNESVKASSTVFDLLKKVSTEKNFTLVYKDSSMGVFVEEIYGVKNDAKLNEYWMYEVDGQLASVGASNYIIKNSDEIEWDYGVVAGY